VQAVMSADREGLIVKQIYEIDEYEGQHFIAMERGQGKNISRKY
jgi:hypothetical protein